MKVLKYRDPVELFDDWGYCKICDYRITDPFTQPRVCSTVYDIEKLRYDKYNGQIRYHFELHLKRNEIKTINIKKEKK